MIFSPKTVDAFVAAMDTYPEPLWCQHGGLVKETRIGTPGSSEFFSAVSLGVGMSCGGVHSGSSQLLGVSQCESEAEVSEQPASEPCNWAR